MPILLNNEKQRDENPTDKSPQICVVRLNSCIYIQKWMKVRPLIPKYEGLTSEHVFINIAKLK